MANQRLQPTASNCCEALLSGLIKMVTGRFMFIFSLVASRVCLKPDYPARNLNGTGIPVLVTQNLNVF
jgi:hypothetical protein